MPLNIGIEAPDFTLTASTGQSVRLYDVLEGGPVVLVFYAKSFTPVCTAEVCGFRDSLHEFTEREGKVLGISPDPLDLTAKFAAAMHLNFPLLVDDSGAVRALYQVPKILGFFPGRATYVVGQDRKIQEVTTAAFRSRVHVRESLQNLKPGTTK